MCAGVDFRGSPEVRPVGESPVGVDHQQLQHFVSSSPWPVEPVRTALARKAIELIHPEVWVIENTGFSKVGNASPGWLGKSPACWEGWQLPDRRIGACGHRPGVVPTELAVVPAAVLGRPACGYGVRRRVVAGPVGKVRHPRHGAALPLIGTGPADTRRACRPGLPSAGSRGRRWLQRGQPFPHSPDRARYSGRGGDQADHEHPPGTGRPGGDVLLRARAQIPPDAVPTGPSSVRGVMSAAREMK